MGLPSCAEGASSLPSLEESSASAPGNFCPKSCCSGLGKPKGEGPPGKPGNPDKSGLMSPGNCWESMCLCNISMWGNCLPISAEVGVPGLEMAPKAGVEGALLGVHSPSLRSSGLLAWSSLLA